MSSANVYIKEWIIDKLNKKNNSNLIGVELEFPIVKNNRQPLEQGVVIALFHYLVQTYDLMIVNQDQHDHPIHIRDEKKYVDISLEYCYGNLELSIGPCMTINEIDLSFRFYQHIITHFLNARHHRILYIGLNPYNEGKCVPVLNTSFHQIMDKIIQKNHQSDHYGFVNAPGIISSVQTHMSISAPHFIDTINFHLLLNGVRAILFSNSAILNNHINQYQYRCLRDFVWKSTGLQADDHAVNTLFNTLDEYCDYLSRLNIYYVKREEAYVYFKPRSLSNYFDASKINGMKYNHLAVDDEVIVVPTQDDIEYFKNFDWVRLTKFGSLEIRGDCQQPEHDTFAPVAFNIGAQCSKDKIQKLLNKHTVLLLNLRKQAVIHGFNACNMHDGLFELIFDITRTVNCALIERGFGEEKYLAGVFSRLKNKQNPAERSMKLLGNRNLSIHDIFQL